MEWILLGLLWVVLIAVHLILSTIGVDKQSVDCVLLFLGAVVGIVLIPWYLVSREPEGTG